MKTAKPAVPPVMPGCLTRLRHICAAGLVLLTLAASAADADTRQPAEAPVFPLSSWQAIADSQLSDECSRELEAVRRYLRSLDTTALMAVKNGRVLFSYGPVDAVSILFSARKSILAMMYGKYVADGTADLDKTLADLGIDDAGGLLPVERQARLRDLLAARSGVYHAAANGGDDLAFAPPRGSQLPGSYFLYNNWDFNAAGSAFEILTRRDIYQAFADDFAIPLQLEDFNVQRHKRTGDGAKSRHLAYHFFLSTRDMARLGYLMLQNGNWRGRQLIPADWVAAITSPITPSAEMHPPSAARRGLGYGYLWWVLEEAPASPLHGGYMAWGVHGQYILVIPQRHLVIAHKRQVPVDGNWNVSWVQPGEFLRAAKMLAAAACDASPNGRDSHTRP